MGDLKCERQVVVYAGDSLSLSLSLSLLLSFSLVPLFVSLQMPCGRQVGACEGE